MIGNAVGANVPVGGAAGAAFLQQRVLEYPPPQHVKPLLESPVAQHELQLYFSSKQVGSRAQVSGGGTYVKTGAGVTGAAVTGAGTTAGGRGVGTIGNTTGVGNTTGAGNTTGVGFVIGVHWNW